jgi:hypothetical protein
MRFNFGGAYITAGLGIISVPLAVENLHLQSGKLVEVLSNRTLGSMPVSPVFTQPGPIAAIRDSL